jgi:hypothetical protein
MLPTIASTPFRQEMPTKEKSGLSCVWVGHLPASLTSSTRTYEQGSAAECLGQTCVQELTVRSRACCSKVGLDRVGQEPGDVER